ncbi:STAS domain-containing protein [Candidatus Poribacteria bacterium]|nr:STAS domain-containing protein [Candidatus Poribacteria bacterium]
MELVVEGSGDGTVRIRVIGELVSSSCGDLRDTVMESAAREPKKVVIDMSAAPFIDTSGLGVLVGLRAHLKSKGVALELSSPGPKVQQVLRMTRLLQVFGLKED